MLLLLPHETGIKHHEQSLHDDRQQPINHITERLKEHPGHSLQLCLLLTATEIHAELHEPLRLLLHQILLGLVGNAVAEHAHADLDFVIDEIVEVVVGQDEPVHHYEALGEDAAAAGV
jgi:hypothetical protein